MPGAVGIGAPAGPEPTASNGVLSKFTHMPRRSGWPSGVRAGTNPLDCPINAGAVTTTSAASNANVIEIRDIEIRLVMPHIVHRPPSTGRVKLSRLKVKQTFQFKGVTEHHGPSGLGRSAAHRGQSRQPAPQFANRRLRLPRRAVRVFELARRAARVARHLRVVRLVAPHGRAARRRPRRPDALLALI